MPNEQWAIGNVQFYQRWDLLTRVQWGVGLFIARLRIPTRVLPAFGVGATMDTLMAISSRKTTIVGAHAAAFATTHWSVVLRAGEEMDDAGASALETLCRSYWYPLYAYIRRLGHSPHDAQDLTQSFFAYLVEKRLVAKADPEAGHFRSFLLGSLKKFMANEWRRAQTQKRGGGEPSIALDAHDAEERYALEPTDPANPQTLYEQAWAAAVFDQAVQQLETEHAAAGKGALFEQLHIFLQGERGARTYAQVGATLGLSEGAVKVAVHRLRQRYRELLRATVANTVADPLEVEEELRHLVQVLSGA
jgi:RNA polymerase sigma-70 factor (ECF subfamily)